MVHCTVQSIQMLTIFVYDIFGMLKLKTLQKIKFFWSVHNVLFLLEPPTYIKIVWKRASQIKVPLADDCMQQSKWMTDDQRRWSINDS